mgnify:CR=1 FL=1
MSSTVNDHTHHTPSDDGSAGQPGRPRGLPAPIGLVLAPFSSVKTGIASLAVLFVYAAIGSAGHYPVIRNGELAWSHQMLRQLRPFEMTEFEWFHTWFFVGLCAFICLNLTVVTFRKIPLTLPRLGVWMIHTGIVVMTVGSVVYFATKVEGDAPVVRRQIEASVDGRTVASLPALPGAERTVQTAQGPWTFRVFDLNPSYTLLSEGLEGQQDFAVTVEVTTPEGQTFYRQLLDDHPGLTEDSVMVSDPAPGERPMQRVRNVPRFNGSLLADDSLSLALTPLPQRSFWLKDSWAVALRDADDPLAPWSHRPLNGMPRYNDYIGSPGEVWPPPGVARFPVDDISVPAPPGDNDAFPDLAVRVTGYLRYAVMNERWRQGSPDDPLYPVVRVQARLDTGERTGAELVAFDSLHDSAFQDLLGVEWVNHPDDLAAVQRSMEGPVIDLRVPGAGERLTAIIDESAISDAEDAPFNPIRETGFGYRVRQIVERLDVPGVERRVSMAEVEIRTPEGDTIRRWVFADPRLTRDVTDAGSALPDSRVEARFVPPAEDVLVAVGPGIGVRVLTRDAEGATVSKTVQPSQFVPIATGVELAVTDVLPRATLERKPAVVPVERRQSDADKAHSFAMAKVQIAPADDPEAVIAERWLPFHPYSFDDEQLYKAGLGMYRPDIIELPDGRRVKAIFTRERRDLPTPVALEDFHLRAHVGGFTGESLSIRDWVSDLRFATPEDPDTFGDITSVRVNHPSSVAGMWYFQSFWDAPREDPATGQTNPGMAFTGLGVGNRNGVYTALAGSTLSVIGMIWAFYVKPVILRRRQQRVYAGLNSNANQHSNTTIVEPSTTTARTSTEPA